MVSARNTRLPDRRTTLCHVSCENAVVERRDRETTRVVPRRWRRCRYELLRRRVGRSTELTTKTEAVITLYAIRARERGRERKPIY